MKSWRDYKVDWPEAQSGDWRIEKFEVPEFSIEGVRLAFAGRPVEPGNYTKLMRKNDLVMSDTRAEIYDCWNLFLNARGTGLINGLGLGMCLRGVLMNPKVRHVTVIEKSVNVVKLIGRHFASSKRVTILNEDAFSYRPRDHFDFVWHD